MLTLLITMLLPQGVWAQYQLANSDFEEWESVSYSGRTGNEPLKWSSFLDGTGNLKSMAGYVQLERSTDKPASSKGSYSAKLTSRAVKMFGATLAVAQGNLTNGCVNMGSTTATDAKGNYNYINTARDDQSMKFTGRPDAVKVWIKFKGDKTGNVEVALAGKGKFQIPENPSVANEAELIARAVNAVIPSNDTWTEYTIPFTYSSESVPAYSLVNISTCATPGAGKEADYLFVDDMIMVYNSELESATFDGNNIVFEGTSATVNDAYDESKLEFTSNGKAATIVTSYDESTCVLTITVKGDNISEDASNYHEYTILFKSAESAEATMTITDALYATFCAPFAVELPQDVKAYTCSQISNNDLELEQIDGSVIPANTPVILWSSNAYEGNYQGTVETPEEFSTHGLLTGVYAKTEVPDGSYVLQNHDGKVAFFKVEGVFTLGANRAYLSVPESNAKAFGFGYGQTTSVDALNSLFNGEAEIYDLNGCKRTSLQKGVNIVNGVKVLVK